MIDFIKVNWFNIITVVISLFAIGFAYHTYKENKKLTKKQQFESTFFSLLKSFQDTVSNLELNKIKGNKVFEYIYTRTVTGDFDREYKENNLLNLDLWETDFGFNSFSDLIIRTFFSDDLPKKYNIKSKSYSYALLYPLKTYYTNFQNILIYIDNSDFLEDKKTNINERSSYIDMFKSTLTSFELVFIFYYYLTAEDANIRESTKSLIEKYSVFETLPKVMLDNSTYDNITGKKLNDSFKNDYERFVSDVKDNERIYNISAFEKNQELFKN